MPDSLPLVRKPRPASPGAPARRSAQETTVGANTQIQGAQHLDAPPRDVGRLLARHGVSLPSYLDAQRWREVAASHERWPHLWSRQPNLPGSQS